MSLSIPVSVYIITLNEQRTIGKCLSRLIRFDEVILVDCGSSDRTVEIAAGFENVRTVYKEWTNFAEQKSYAMSLCSNEWVLNVDADEIVTDEYIQEVETIVTENIIDALESNRTLYRWGKRPKCFGADDRLIRLFRRSNGTYDHRRVHESISVQGKIARTNATIEHHENLSYSERINKSNSYSQAKAEDKFEKGDSVGIFGLLFVFPLVFIQVYFIKGHFLDGTEGVLTSMNAAFYRFMNYAKLWELNNRRLKD